MRSSDWSSDVCSSDLDEARLKAIKYDTAYAKTGYAKAWIDKLLALDTRDDPALAEAQALLRKWDWNLDGKGRGDALALMVLRPAGGSHYRSEEHTSELQSLMRISYAVFCLKKKKYHKSHYSCDT